MHGAVAVQFVQADAEAAGPLGAGPLVGAVGQPGEHVQPGLGAADPDPGQVGAERLDQDVPLGPVVPAHRAQVALERGLLDERRHRDLVQGRRGHAGDQQHVLDVVDQVRGRDEPGQPQRRGQRLAGRADERHQVRRQSLQRRDGIAAEAVLDVVVVLDDQRPALAGPGDQGAAALGRHHHPGRVVVRRRDHHRVHVGRGELGNHQPVRVDPDRDGLEPGVFGGVPLPAPAGVLDRHAAPAVFPDHVPEHGQRLGGRAADDHVIGFRHHAPDPAQVAGHGVPELGGAAVAGVAEPPVRQLAQGTDQRRLPPGAREGVVVGLTGPQVVAEVVRRAGLPRGRRPGRGGQRGDPGARTAPRRQVTLDGQLGVAVDDHAAGHVQLLGQVPGRRQHGAGRQPARPDRHPQRVFQLAAERHARPEFDLQFHAQKLPGSGRGDTIGLIYMRAIGPTGETTGRLG